MRVRGRKYSLRFPPMSYGRSGIYVIYTENGAYIGKADSFGDRWEEHYKMLRRNVHPNAFLQRDWNVLGADELHFQVIEEVDDEPELTERESYWIEQYRKRGNCYNGFGMYCTALMIDFFALRPRWSDREENKIKW